VKNLSHSPLQTIAATAGRSARGWLGVGAVVWAVVGGSVALAEGLAPGGLPASEMPKELAAVGLDEHLDSQVDLSLEFQSHNGETVSLESLLSGDIPTLLTLNYYMCEILCLL
jgi:cytochrome oxidase Cu insertion factor (SCO1/SenC/PrrC family)